MHSLLARAIGGFVAAISAIFAIAKIYIWIVDISTVIDDSKALPEKGKAVLTWIGEQPVIAFYGSLTFFIVIGLWLAFRTGSDQSSAGGPRKIWPWQWRKIDQLEILYLPQWVAVASSIWRHLHQLGVAASSIYSEQKNLCVWNKSNAGMGSLYRSKHELVVVYKVGTAPHINNFELGRTGRYRTNVWDYAGVNTFGKNRDAMLAMHPTVKPVALVADAIKDCSRRD